jgi:predicted nucleic acid-binding protein
MSSVLIDSNILLDIMTEDVRWLQGSAEAFERAADRYRLVINPVIFAEVSDTVLADRESRRRASENHVRP